MLTRINEFRAKPGKTSELIALVDGFLPSIEALEGCHGVELLRRVDRPNLVIVIERWESPKHHAEAAKAISPETISKAKELLAVPPQGAFFQAV